MSLVAALRAGRGSFTLDVDIEVGARELLVVVGPNGSGKTTMLRALAGLLPVDEGRITLDGTVLDDPSTGTFVPPERRPSAVVFPEARLFAHLSVLDNVAFGLRCRGRTRAAARATATGWLGRVGLADRASDRPDRLSSGQAQRVALARALATEPRLLLLDEPLGALDVATRVAMRRELRHHLTEHDGVRVLVTHDPLEAMALADRLVVLEAGRVVQTGTPDDVRSRPRTRYVGELVGVNLFRGRADADRVALDDGGELAVAGAGHGPVLAVVHPHAVSLHPSRPAGSPRNAWATVVEHLDHEGDRVRVRLAGPPPLVAEVTPAAAAELGLAPGSPVWATVKATEVAVTPA